MKIFSQSCLPFKCIFSIFASKSILFQVVKFGWVAGCVSVHISAPGPGAARSTASIGRQPERGPVFNPCFRSTKPAGYHRPHFRRLPLTTAREPEPPNSGASHSDACRWARGGMTSPSVRQPRPSAVASAAHNSGARNHPRRPQARQPPSPCRSADPPSPQVS